MTKSPAITVLIPCLNETDRIIETLARVLSDHISVQSVLVADGGSTDGSIEKVVRFSHKHPKVILCVDPPNLPPEESIPRALSLVGTSHVFICGSDDWPDGGLLSELANKIYKNPNLAKAFTPMRFVYESLNPNDALQDVFTQRWTPLTRNLNHLQKMDILKWSLQSLDLDYLWYGLWRTDVVKAATSLSWTNRSNEPIHWWWGVTGLFLAHPNFFEAKSGSYNFYRPSRVRPETSWYVCVSTKEPISGRWKLRFLTDKVRRRGGSLRNAVLLLKTRTLPIRQFFVLVTVRRTSSRKLHFTPAPLSLPQFKPFLDSIRVGFSKRATQS